MYSRQFGGLRSALVSESADLAGYLFYQELNSTADLSQKAWADAAKSQAKTIVGAAAGGPVPNSTMYGALTGDDQIACVKDVEDKFAADAFAGSGSAPLDDLCSAPTSPADSYRCELAFALRAALKSDPKSAEDHLMHAAGALLADVLSVNLPAAVAIDDSRKKDSSLP